MTERGVSRIASQLSSGTFCVIRRRPHTLSLECSLDSGHRSTAILAARSREGSYEPNSTDLPNHHDAQHNCKWHQTHVR